MSLRHALLGLLAVRPASGYELTKEFEVSLANVWSARHSQIYPELQKLAAGGLVEPGEEGSRGRKEYAITDAGRAELRRWLTTEEPDRSPRNEALLRTFFLWTLPADEAADYLDREAAAYRENGRALRDLDATIPWDETGHELMARVVLEGGLRWSAAMADWAEWAAGQLRDGADATSLTGRRRQPKG